MTKTQNMTKKKETNEGKKTNRKKTNKKTCSKKIFFSGWNYPLREQSKYYGIAIYTSIEDPAANETSNNQQNT